MNWFYYLLEANIYFCILYAFYGFFLKHERFYVLNRWYLIGLCFISFTLPFFSVTYHTFNQTAVDVQPSGNIIYDQQASVIPSNELATSNNVENSLDFTLDQVFLMVYISFVLLLIFKLGNEIRRIISLYKISEKELKGKAIFVFIDLKGEIFSFFNWLFIDPKLQANEAIIAHEMIHIKQGHSYDVLFFEMLRCLNWFNPLFRLLIKDAKLNHEYISDQQIAGVLMNSYDYANLLIQYAYEPRERLSHSAFEKTQLERRIKQLGNKHSGMGMLKYLALPPLILTLFFFAAFKVEKSYSAFNFVIDKGIATNKDKQKTVPSTKVNKDVVAGQVVTAVKIADITGLSKQVAVKANEDVIFSELIAGPRELDKIAAKLAEKGEKLYARDYLLNWTINTNGSSVRKVTHGVLSGTEAQLFRGDIADTLYVDQKYYELKKNTVNVLTDNLMIGYAEHNQYNQKKLIIIDAYQQKIIHKLNEVDIRTKGSIYKVVTNPDYGYEKKALTDTVPSKYVDMKAENAKFKYILSSLNSHVREAKITANQIITNETNLPKEDPWQPGIIW